MGKYDFFKPVILNSYKFQQEFQFSGIHIT